MIRIAAASWRGGVALALAVILTSTIVRRAEGQGSATDNIATTLDRSLRDSNLVSPIFGTPVSPEALKVVGETINAPTIDVRLRMARALSRSGVAVEEVAVLLESLSQLGSEPTLAHVQGAQDAFNSFVNAASYSFLIDPSPEFLALHAVLLRLSAAVGSASGRRAITSGA